MIHIKILKSIKEIPFGLYEKDLIKYLKGDESFIIKKHKLNEFESYGVLFKETLTQIQEYLNFCKKHNLIENKNKQISITAKGSCEILQKKLKIPKIVQNQLSPIEEKLINSFHFFLENFNEAQKKAIVCQDEKILCVAGAGSGKTTVLVKRIEFLIRFLGVKTNEILAITFTKKAKNQMISRLANLGIETNVETFNSFSEKILKKSNKGIVIDYKTKILLVNQAIKNVKFDFELFKEEYFSKKVLAQKNEKELYFNLINDIFSCLDFVKNTKIGFAKFYSNLKGLKYRLGEDFYNLLVEVDNLMKSKNLRDFSDQVLDVIDIFKNNKNSIPKYKYILIDEFQDVNEVQYDLIKLLEPKNLFAVGDPRQAIFSWRGATDEFINNFPQYFKNSQIIYLFKNYRSCKNIVDASNVVICDLMLPNLESAKEEGGKIILKEFKDLHAQVNFIVDKIKDLKIQRSDVFILARTNKILENVSDFLKFKKVKHYLKKDENDEHQIFEDEILLSTVHSIKGLEAKYIFLIEANVLYFPNKVKDNFIVDSLKDCFKYDKYKEELRLFYVAMTRAEEQLFITYSKTKTKFLTSQINFFIDKENTLLKYKSFNNSTIQRNLLKNVRLEISEELGMKTYQILTNQEIEYLVKLKPSKISDLYELSFQMFRNKKYADKILKVFE